MKSYPLEWQTAGGLSNAFLSQLEYLSSESDFPMWDQRISSRVEQLENWRDNPSVNRHALSMTVKQINEHYDNVLSEDVIKHLNEDALLVVAGQQPGLMMNPVFGFYKILTTIKIANQLTEQLKRPVYPAFWMATEDHDIEEVNRFTIHEGKHYVQDHGQLQGPRPPVGELRLESARVPIMDFLARHLSEEPNYEELINDIKHMNFSSYAALYASWIKRMFGTGQVILLDPMMMRPLTAPVLSKMVAKFDHLQDALAKGAVKLESHDIQPPLNAITLFRFIDQARRSCRFQDGRMILPETNAKERSMSLEDTAALVLAEPEAFSPSAGLRPLTQDAALPVAVMVGGPSELKYLWQIDGLYEQMGIQRSWLSPRISVTVTDFATLRAASKLGLHGSDVFNIQTVVQNKRDQQRTDDERLKRILEQSKVLISTMQAEQNEANVKWLTKSTKSIFYQTERTITKLIQQREIETGDHRRIARVQESIHPGNTLQERRLGAPALVARYGWRLFDQMRVALSDDVLKHQLLVVDERIEDRMQSVKEEESGLTMEIDEHE